MSSILDLERIPYKYFDLLPAYEILSEKYIFKGDFEEDFISKFTTHRGIREAFIKTNKIPYQCKFGIVKTGAFLTAGIKRGEVVCISYEEDGLSFRFSNARNVIPYFLVGGEEFTREYSDRNAHNVLQKRTNDFIPEIPPCIPGTYSLSNLAGHVALIPERLFQAPSQILRQVSADASFPLSEPFIQSRLGATLVHLNCVVRCKIKHRAKVKTSIVLNSSYSYGEFLEGITNLLFPPSRFMLDLHNIPVQANSHKTLGEFPVPFPDMVPTDTGASIFFRKTKILGKILKEREIKGQFHCSVVLSPPNKRKSDIDNYTKVCLDFCQRSGIIENDNLCKMLLVVYGSKDAAPLGARLTLTPV